MARSLVDEVRQFLDEQRGNWPRICRETSLDYSWLCKVAQGQIENPGIRKIEKLAQYMDEHRNAA